MTDLEFEIGKEYRIYVGTHFSIGIVDKVTPKWIRIQGTYRTPKNKWILREKIESNSYKMREGNPIIISQMY